MARFKISLVLFVTGAFISCRQDVGIPAPAGNFPKPVGRILETRCAISGCHNQQSKDAAAGLSLASWNSLFEGGRGGPAVIPFRPDYSTLCFYTNSFENYGPALQPRMPIGSDALSREEFELLRNWIIDGAPDINGQIFPGHYGSKNKVYVLNRQCDLVSVIDAETMLPVRCLQVGRYPQIEFPYSIKVSPDARYWLISFFSPNGLIQKYNTLTDEMEGELNLGPGAWSTFAISDSSTSGFFLNHANPGSLVFADLQQMKILSEYTLHLSYPHGIGFCSATKKLFVGSEYGNYLYSLDVSDPYKPVASQVILDGSAVPNENYSESPRHFAFTKDGKTAYVSCQASNKIRVLNTQNNLVMASIALPAAPEHLCLDEQRGRLFISCPFDSLSFADNIGSVNVIDLKTLTLLKSIKSGFQPYGLGILSRNNLLVVAHANTHPKGPRPHHESGCGGRNGYVTYIDLQTLELIKGKKYELAVFPLEVTVKENAH